MMEQIYTYTVHNVEETYAMATLLAKYVQAGDVIALVGDLGAGKTTFTQGLAKGLGIMEQVNSPTFTIIKEYEGRLPLYHMDVYRLTGEEDLGFDEYFSGDGVTVVEWPSQIAALLPEELLWIEIRATKDDERQIRLRPQGERYIKLCKELDDEYSRN